ncbi:MAG: tRNA lysidine(34) synthetase TilS, partial [Ignavibacteria bacterium]|nr:tRNA lysidine(34) synthetase TilS [Ignavibacteria bacterium]
SSEINLGSGWKIKYLKSEQIPTFSKDGKIAALDADLLYDLFLNNYAPGDRFTPYGMHGKTVKLGDYWTNIGLPERARKRWPLLRNGNGEIVWVIGTQISERYKITPTTKNILILNLTQMQNES